MKYLIVCVVLLSQMVTAQQYGWVKVAQIGNQFNTLQSVAFVDSLYGWIGDGTTGFHYTQDGGNSWSPGSGATVVPYSISMLNRSVGWAAGSSGSFGGIHQTTNGGLTWTQQYYLINRNYIGTASLTLGKNITSGYTRNFSPDTGKVVQTSNGGATWTEGTILDSLMDLRKMQFIDSLHGWVVGGSPLNGVYAVLRTVDGGTNWQVIRTVVGFQAVSFIDSVNGWSVKRDSPTYCFKTSDGGITWMQLGRIEDPMWGDLNPRALSFADSLNGWAFGIMFYAGDLAAVIFRTTDGGVSWIREHVGGARTIFDGMMLDRWHGWAVGGGGSVFAYRIVTSAPERIDRTPKLFSLKQNYPNPFNPTTTIEYEVIARGQVTIGLYDTQGKQVRTLVNSEHEPGVYRIYFDANGLASGVYYYTLKTHAFTETKQMILVK